MENLCSNILQSTKIQICSQACSPSCRCKEKDLGREHAETVEAMALLAEIRYRADINTSGIEWEQKNASLVYSVV